MQIVAHQPEVPNPGVVPLKDDHAIGDAAHLPQASYRILPMMVRQHGHRHVKTIIGKRKRLRAGGHARRGTRRALGSHDR